MDIYPHLCTERSLKIGTFKVNPHGTRLGERFIKKSLDVAIRNNIKIIYTTIFPKHKALINILLEYGFEEHGFKISGNSEELVLVKNLNTVSKDVFLDYPLINLNNCNKYLLAIYPKYHTKLFPDSKLFIEGIDIVKDVSYTNSIRKIYISGADVSVLKRGDIIVIYRTKDGGNVSAEYGSVATSICVVDYVESIYSFETLEDFIDVCKPYSIFSESELKKMYETKRVYNTYDL